MDNLGLNDELYDTASASTSGSSKTCDKIIDSEIFDSTATTSDISKPSTSKDSFDPLDKNQPNKRTISEGKLLEPEKSRTNLEQEMSVKMSTLPQYEHINAMKVIAIPEPCGIDYDVKLWAPISPEAHFDSKKANEEINGRQWDKEVDDDGWERMECDG
ncbi:hypothetical protein GQR58_018957 [Nymphon striatum]|nr:hypothetical protein GQR58_018957 [Nymphon striatum]